MVCAEPSLNVTVSWKKFTCVPVSHTPKNSTGVLKVNVMILASLSTYCVPPGVTLNPASAGLAGKAGVLRILPLATADNETPGAKVNDVKVPSGALSKLISPMVPIAPAAAAKFAAAALELGVGLPGPAFRSSPVKMMSEAKA